MEDRSPKGDWRENVYRGDNVPQLTARALVTGAVLGALMGASNLYVGLKMGWSMGVVVTASVGGWAVWQLAHRLGLSKRAPTELELNAMASTASAAGYSTGTTLASAVAAHLMLTGVLVDGWVLGAWILSVSLLGLCIAIPLKRQLIDREELPFPSGAAAAETIRGLVAGAGDGTGAALLRAVAVGAGLKLLVGIVPVVVAATGLPTFLSLPPSIPTAAMAEVVPWLGTAAALTFGLELSVLSPAAGAFVGWRVGWSMCAGAVLCFGVLAPKLHAVGLIGALGYTSIVDWSMWPGTTLLVVGGLLSLLSRPMAFVRAARAWTWSASSDEIEVPGRWALLGFAGASMACVAVAHRGFGVPIGWGVVSVVLAVVLATVAARVTGETDVTPTGPLAKLSQLALGAGLTTDAGSNVMGAGVSAGAAASAADLLTDLKSGRLLGANPRRQFAAQLVGVVVGAVCVVPIFRYVLVANASALGSSAWPAPAARAWALLAQLVATPGWALEPHVLWSVAVAAVAAAVFAVLPKIFPRATAWTPSPIGLGLAFILPASTSLGIFAGAALVVVLLRRPSQPARGVLIYTVAAGLIAGESLVGVVAALLTTAAL